VRKGRFRQDLLYRLNVFPITVPPLRQRREDIPLLVNLFVNRFCKKLGRTITNIPKSVITDLQQHHWPGNIRELENTIERAVVSTKGTTLLLVDRFETPDSEHPEERPIKSLSNIERDHIIQALKSTNWRISGKKGAALLLDLHPNTLRYRMAKLNINRNS
jgi:transcriptional regulator with GAF, ATPase, and Fis domain